MGLGVAFTIARQVVAVVGCLLGGRDLQCSSGGKVGCGTNQRQIEVPAGSL